MKQKLLTFKKQYLLGIFGIVLATVFSILASLLTSRVIDNISNDISKLNYATFILLAAVVVISGLFNAVLKQYYPVGLGCDAAIEVQEIITKDLLNSSQKVYNDREKGYYMNLLTSSAFTYGDLYTQFLVIFIGNLISAIILVGVAMYVNIYFGIAFLLFIPLCWLITRKPAEKISDYQRKGLETQDKFLNQTKKIVEIKREINIAKADNYFFEKFRESIYSYLNFIKSLRFYETLSTNAPQIFTAFFQVILLAVSVNLIKNGSITIGTVIMVYQLSSVLKEPVYDCVEVLTYRQMQKPHIERIEDFDELSKAKSGFEDNYIENADKAVILKNVSLYTSDKRERKLFDIDSLEIDKGNFVVIKGDNGSGKSLLVNYLTGFSESKSADGSFKIDAKFRDVAYQTYPLIVVNGDLSENMFGEKMDESLLDILNINFKDKQIIENPINLSFGEQQKINLLRVLSKDKDVLILDEPYSNLDRFTQDRLNEYLKSIKGNKTILAIMHSDDLDEIADKIIRIKGGKIIFDKI
ncbi:ABC transporter ATP-binding protein [Anaerococcus sp. AGMB09787]|uniref:ABC transporter transmembrane domain-containing protein n=1 Tax=Anaerococcus sp. AGMB09787 TaxID=2922869 RepID=UPI001FAF73E5|nr:ABC transporter ATP-binding protein [Anaerococcus sp. AGMB09787]